MIFTIILSINRYLISYSKYFENMHNKSFYFGYYYYRSINLFFCILIFVELLEFGILQKTKFYNKALSLWRQLVYYCYSYGTTSTIFD